MKYMIIMQHFWRKDYTFRGCRVVSQIQETSHDSQFPAFYALFFEK